MGRDRQHINALEDNNNNDGQTASNADRIGSTNLWVGGCRSGRPLQCWEAFDALLNVNKNKYPNMQWSVGGPRV
jgi:hypothetical protein